jgi:hygromycin-B 7''-O-kinase
MMMNVLPQNIDDDIYWRNVYKQPLSFWELGLREIARLHDLPIEGWTRAALGRNVVFLSPIAVIKLGPPCWPDEMPREAAALQYVCGRLPVATPKLIATGTLDGWDYLVEECLPGRNLRELWQELETPVRLKLAQQHGELMAAIHTLPQNDLPPILRFDWAGMLGYQAEACAREMLASGVDEALVKEVDAYLAATPWEIEQGSDTLVHGDLDRLNLMVCEVAGNLKITGIIDWGDVKIGPPSHDFISPAMHSYKGERALLRAWYQGYQLLAQDQLDAYQHVILARSMMYYSDSFAKYIQSVPDASSCTDWSMIASRFLQMN